MVRLTRTCSPSCRPVFFLVRVYQINDAPPASSSFRCITRARSDPARLRSPVPPLASLPRDEWDCSCVGRFGSIFNPALSGCPSALGSNRLQGFGRGVESSELGCCVAGQFKVDPV